MDAYVMDDENVRTIKGAAACASCSKLLSRSAFSASQAGKTLIATSRPSFVSGAPDFTHAAFADFGNNRGLSERCVWENGFAQIMRDPAVTLALCVSENRHQKN